MIPLATEEKVYKIVFVVNYSFTQKLRFEHVLYIGATRGEEGKLFLPFFFKIEKKAPILVHKHPDYVHLYVEFIIQNIVLRVSRRNLQNCSCVFNKMLIKVP